MGVCALGVIVAATLAASAADARSPSSRQGRVVDETAFDGAWSVLIQANGGQCSGTYRYGVDIVDGTVTYQGTPYGRVAPNGSVRVRMDVGGQQADGIGRLARGAGSGVWRGVGQTGSCTGRWVAERRAGTYGAGR
jgi:hypothetical protein